MKTKKQINEETHGKQLKPRWFWLTEHGDAEVKREKLKHKFLAKAKLNDVINAQREILDMPKDFVKDIMNEKKHDYHMCTNMNGQRFQGGIKEIKIEKEGEGGNINQSAVFSKNYNKAISSWNGHDIGDTLIGFMHQISTLKEIKKRMSSRPYFTSVDKVMQTSESNASYFVSTNFPNASEHLKVQCGTYDSEIFTKRKYALENPYDSDGIEREVPEFRVLSRTNTIKNVRGEYKSGLDRHCVKSYTTEPFLKPSKELSIKTKTTYKGTELNWTLHVPPRWHSTCEHIGVCEMGQRKLFPLHLKREHEEWIDTSGKELYYGTFVDFSFTKRTEENGYTDKDGKHKGYEFTPKLLEDHYVMLKRLPSGEVMTAVSQNIGQANKLLTRKVVKAVANTLESKHEN
jgi:hypothetical protein